MGRSQPSLLQTALAESAGGATAGIVADSVLYAIDSAKVRAQSQPVAKRSLSILFRGLVPNVLLGSVPIFGSFFFLFAPIREELKENNYESCIPLASAVCAVPATIIGVPSDVLKKRLVLGIDPSVRVAVSRVTMQHGWKGFFAGWHVNLLRDLPFASLKISLYEFLVFQWRQSSFHDSTNRQQPISPVGAGVCGMASGIGCAILTCPLDVVNTRIKAGNTNNSLSIVKVGKEIYRKEGISALFRGVAMRSVVLGIGSSIFWPIQHSVASHLQQ
mmetsp:Transcript_4650/g.6730  ORF Transcript_4650/g.6730 Transcript_4650/m.6730 type:complete len:274 (+) Transcript_4650:368-1189(+)